MLSRNALRGVYAFDYQFNVMVGTEFIILLSPNNHPFDHSCDEDSHAAGADQD